MNLNPKDVSDVVSSLEARAASHLRAGNDKAAIDDMKEIIAIYRELGCFERADIVELTMNQFLDECVGDVPDVVSELSEPHTESSQIEKDRAEFIHRISDLRAILQRHR